MAEVKEDRTMDSHLLLPAVAVTISAGGAVDDGTGAESLARMHKRRVYVALGITYWAVAVVVFWFVENWDMAETSVFLLSVVTGCGYGHLVPSGSVGKVITSVFIVSGLILFATVAGQILDFLVRGEIEYVVGALGPDLQDAASHQEKRQKEKRHQFLTGLVNLSVLFSCSVSYLAIVWNHPVADAIYLAAVTVLRLDTICMLDEVKCSHGWHASDGGNLPSLACTAVWYVLTYGTIGHFLVSASSYLGADSEAQMTTLKKFDHHRLARMDKDGDGTVTRSEFLRDRLIQVVLV